jgi:uncharacterized coiled-coil DUF342 family protein
MTDKRSAELNRQLNVQLSDGRIVPLDDEHIAELNRQLNELRAEADWYKMHMLNLQRQFDMQQGNAPASDALAEVRQLRTEMMQLFAQVLAALEALTDAAKRGEHA